MELKREKLVVLTFDDGPQKTNDALLEVLKARNTHATFFMIGDKIKERPELVREIAAQGHDVAWHSMSHSLHSGCTAEFVENDIKSGIELITEVVGKPPKFFRAPGGHMNEAICLTAAKYGLKQFNWSNYSFIDKEFESIPAQVRADATFNTKSGIRNGEILLIHPRDNEELVKGIGLMIDRFHREGYRVVSLSEISELRKDGIVACYGPVF